jgi:immunoglobulin-binding protein 1
VTRCLDEIQILSRFEGNSNSDDTEHSQARASGSKPEAGKKPFVITKNQLQAAVFGAGYPSLPVYSIDQFYDQLQDRGMMPQDGCCAPSKNGKILFVLNLLKSIM